MNKKIAYCGLDCSVCDAYLATVNDDEALRKKTAKLWSELNGVAILPNQIHCEGCRENGKKSLYCESLCPIRQCALKKSLSSCGDCAQMTDCETVGAILSNNSSALENLRAEAARKTDGC